MKSLGKPAITHPRRGSIVLALALSLLVILAGIALVLDRMWIDAAQMELLTASESAALAGARELASDDLLRTGVTADRRIAAARQAAVRIAQQNLVAGDPLILNLDGDSDVKVGQIAASSSTGYTMFLETAQQPTTVLVKGRRLRSRGNPIALLMRQSTQQPAADLVVSAEATIDNRVVGVSPADGFAVPALPIAILATDSSGMRKDTWQEQIVNRKGGDQFGYDPVSGSVTQGPDGIPEILLRSQDKDDKASLPNLAAVDLGTQLRDAGLVGQIQNGWSATDLQTFGASQVLLPGPPLSLSATAFLGSPSLNALQQIQGECRICLLYVPEPAVDGSTQSTRVSCTALVAGRILNVIRAPRTAPQIVFQPGVIVTRTAVVGPFAATGSAASGSAASGSATTGPGPAAQGFNPNTIYKLSLTQ